MSHSTQYIADQLRSGRESKGLTQRELGELSGVPQGQISRIERGAVDLRLSSLVQLARALELELLLVPRAAETAVSAVIRSSTRSSRRKEPAGRDTARELKRLTTVANEVSSAADNFPEEMSRVVRHVRDLSRFELIRLDAHRLRSAHDAIREYAQGSQREESLLRALEDLEWLRNEAVHGSSRPALSEEPRAAYALTEEDDV